eukprot:9055485-Alexandrium_andersonii.AAC.1
MIRVWRRRRWQRQHLLRRTGPVQDPFRISIAKQGMRRLKQTNPVKRPVDTIPTMLREDGAFGWNQRSDGMLSELAAAIGVRAATPALPMMDLAGNTDVA